ncbi:MAG TPA: hypothetical protein VHX15_13800 [Frankiaceae bacterium]|jgi:hypothetical protein|nr:hypothetical protein [Frankiaceae bacterium]
MRPYATAHAIRTVVVAAAAIGSAAACATPSSRVGLHSLGWADTNRPVQVSAQRSVAVSFTPARDGQIDAVNLVASRDHGQAVGLLAYVVTPDDPTTRGPAKPVAAPAGTEPGCWGSATDAALSATAQQLTIKGNACPVRAGHTYWIQLATVLGAANLYPRQGTVVGTMLSRPAPGASWERVYVTGGLEVSPVTHPVTR